MDSKLRLGVIGLIILAIWWGTLSTARAREGALFSLTQAKDRTGRGSFPHDQKEHIKVQCADCHLAAKEKPRNTDQPMAKDFPHGACIRCHNFAAEFFKAAFGQSSRFCGVCHEPRRISRADKALRPGVFPRPKISDFEDAFSHKAHRKSLPADFRVSPISNPPYGSQFSPGASPRCTDCHAQTKQPAARRRQDDASATVVQAVQMRSIEFKTEKSHAVCFVCHGGTPPEPRRMSAETFPYQNDCRVCHELETGQPSGSKSLFGSIKDFHHDDHDLDIRPKKRSDFPLPTAPDRLCSECHKPIEQVEKLKAIRLPEAGYCNTCHISKRPGLPDRLSEEVLNRLKSD
ncbi:MAG TPA: hypothetical protein VLM38_21965 [Blastocatellia bacterium]|nr:hypothetical protein [Blastocatellia bacterium]